MGILTTKEAYGFVIKKPSDADMTKYVKYAQLSGCTSSYKVWFYISYRK